MTPRTIEHAGLTFDVAEEDGEILDARLDSRLELAAALDWPFTTYAGWPHLRKSSAREIEAWAMRYFARDVQDKIDWRLWSLAETYGVRAYGPPY